MRRGIGIVGMALVTLVLTCLNPTPISAEGIPSNEVHLRLLIAECPSGDEIEGAMVVVTVKRNGNTVEEADGETDEEGFVDISLYQIEVDDVAHVAIRPTVAHSWDTSGEYEYQGTAPGGDPTETWDVSWPIGECADHHASHGGYDDVIKAFYEGTSFGF